MTTCPCSSNRPFEECCAPVIAGSPAPTAEALMRSRFTAFVKRTLDHVEETHAPEVKADFNRAEAERMAEECEWVSLHIHRTKESEDSAEIEFVLQVRHEQKLIAKAAISRFRRDEGKWLFVSSKPAPHLAHLRTTKTGRNDQCPCNSGKKFKKCCGNSAELQGV